MLTKQQKIEQVLTRGVVQALPSKKALADLMMKRKIKVYLGVDPTGPKLHLGHVIPLRKLAQFQKLGHEAILLFGTFTAQIGDPSERDSKRKSLTPAQIKKNIKTYKKQVSKIIDLSKVKILKNANWLSPLKFDDLIKLTSHFTVSRLLERSMFQKRLKKGGEVFVSEVLYPLMQGYDSVAMNVDLEVGGNDQLFNMLVGRKLQKIYNNKEKFVLTGSMLEGLDGREMSKTFNNTVNLEDSSDEMFGKIMSLRDNLIPSYFELCTNVSLKEIGKIKKDLKSKKINPRDLKARLAQEIVTIYHGKIKAQKAKKEFERIFKQKRLPTKIPVIKIKQKSLNILDLLVKTKMADSKAQAKRLIAQNGVKINNIVQKDWRKKIILKKRIIIQKGKRKFIKII